MVIDFAKINYLAVAAAGMATFFLGAVWYMFLFGKLWIKLHGYTEEKMKEMQKKVPPPLFFSGMILSYLLIALVLAILITGLDLKTPLDGALLGLIIWIGPAAAIHFTGQLASDKHIGTYLIDIGYQFVYLLMMGAILGAWRG